MEVAVIAKALAFIVAIIAGFLGIRHYGSLREEKGRERGISEAREVNDENYTGLADDVLDGGHPYRVRNSGATEITSPGADPGVRMAPDVRPEGESERLARDRNGSS